MKAPVCKIILWTRSYLASFFRNFFPIFFFVFWPRCTLGLSLIHFNNALVRDNRGRSWPFNIKSWPTVWKISRAQMKNENFGIAPIETSGDYRFWMQFVLVHPNLHSVSTDNFKTSKSGLFTFFNRVREIFESSRSVDLVRGSSVGYWHFEPICSAHQRPVGVPCLFNVLIKLKIVNKDDCF